MTREQFKTQADRLVGTYGKAAYPPERLRLLYDRLGDADARDLSVAVDELIATQRSAPMVPQVLEAVGGARERRLENSALLPRPARPAGPTGCGECSGLGYRTARAPDGYEFIARCRCPAGQSVPERYLAPTEPSGERQTVTIRDTLWFEKAGSER